MASIRFPCSFFFEWKTATGKSSIASKNKVKVVNGSIPFNDKLTMKVHMIYDTGIGKYRKKESIVLVNLLSNSRPNDPKLVGRVTVDLAKVATGGYIDMRDYNLEYCSVNAWIRFKIELKNSVVTSLDVNDLDRSDFGEF